MMNQITGIIEQLSSTIGGEHGISTDKLSAVNKETQDSIMSSLKGAVSGGNIGQVTDLFKGKSGGSNPLVAGMISTLTGNLTKNVGLGKDTASGFAGSIIPKVIEMMGSSKGKSNGFDVTDLISTLGGGGKDGLLGKLGKLGGFFGK